MMSYNLFYKIYFKHYRNKFKYISYKIIQKKIHIKWKIYEYKQQLLEEQKLSEEKSTKISWKDELCETRYF